MVFFPDTGVVWVPVDHVAVLATVNVGEREFSTTTRAVVGTDELGPGEVVVGTIWVLPLRAGRATPGARGYHGVVATVGGTIV